MAKSDKIISLVKAGALGDKQQFKRVTESLIADERAKKHHVIAERLEDALRTISVSNATLRPRDYGFSKIASLVDERHPAIKLSELVLNPSITESINELIAEQSRADLLRSYSLEPRNRLLLIGPPGNGKTSIAEALAEALMVPLIVVRYEGVIGSYLGETASNLKKVIEFASSRRCVLFFDEFDTLGKERGDTHDTGEVKRVVSSLLMQIDSLPSHVVVVGATNHSELLDRAVWRRFQIRLEVPMPTRSQISKWFSDFEQHHGISLGYAPETLAKKLSGANFSEVKEFGTTVLRKMVLSLPDANMKDICAETVKNWHKVTYKNN
ncbi:AAA ATPase central domain protein [Ferrimonas balearica DSM 9799]|uniref:AAA ATPase central domain protein n=1 Tax=Ferrimonas balearica (strain DSM 9799 / CCM 4581 / KCTC 23876 / PAT) TaxID=550540 RepID=E1SP28_FERBD|nr:AAA family ATPase [Ferrimonas balearica]ADN74677.1 AAA ATPase central domain protein [Ferrimonas balearica DSM 9799]